MDDVRLVLHVEFLGKIERSGREVKIELENERGRSTYDTCK